MWDRYRQASLLCKICAIPVRTIVNAIANVEWENDESDLQNSNSHNDYFIELTRVIVEEWKLR